VKLGYVYLAVPLAGVFIVFYTALALRDAVRGEVLVGEQSSGLN
jgi:TRAP-type C4-dicarboxylate transport system permease small subunit